MPWMLLLHIITLIGWCGSLIYLPVLISTVDSPPRPFEKQKQVRLPRRIFTGFLTPVALLAITSGTVVFISTNTIALWLIIKLTLVIGLVACHALNGLLIIRTEREPERDRRWACFTLAAVSIMLIIGILFVVLAKPF